MRRNSWPSLFAFSLVTLPILLLWIFTVYAQIHEQWIGYSGIKSNLDIVTHGLRSSAVMFPNHLTYASGLLGWIISLPALVIAYHQYRQSRHPTLNLATIILSLIILITSIVIPFTGIYRFNLL